MSKDNGNNPAKEAALRSQAMILANDLRPLIKKRFELTNEIEAISQKLKGFEHQANEIKRERLMVASSGAPRPKGPKARKPTVMVSELAALLGKTPEELERIFKL